MSNSLVRDAVRVALGIGAVAALTVSPNALAQEEDPAQLGRIVTTGSRISRLDVETARPITVISREDIERSGQPTVADVLRNTTYNSFGEYRETSGNSFAGQALVGLKGLGATRTLILLNGRRLPRSPVTSDQAIDLNTIPLEAVERIEILTDSASAIYGSDAIGGVVNIILRKDFEGVQFVGSMSSPSQKGADSTSGSLMFGGSSARSNFIVAVESYNKDIIFSRDRPYTAVDRGDGVNYGTTEGISEYGNTLWDFWGGGGVGGPDRADPNCDNVMDPASGSPLFTGIYNSGPNQYCTYGYADIAGETQKIDRDSVFINAQYEITPDVIATYTGTYSQLESFGRYAPAVGGFYIDLDLIPNLHPDWQDLQGIDAVGGYDAVLIHRFVGLGPRDDTNTNILFDNQLAFTGTAGRFDWDVSVSKTQYTGKEIGSNYVKTSSVELLTDTGVYNPLDPLSPDNEDAYGQMRHTTTRDIETDFTHIQGSLSFDAGELPAGPVGWAVGFDYNDQRFKDVYDPDRVAQDVIGSAGSSTAGDRSSYSVFTETLLPLTDNIELSAAARYDDYSDNSGSEVSPYLSLRYRPTENLLLRASWGEGFRAPNMTNLYSATGFSAESTADLVYCQQENIDPCGDSQSDTWSGGNPLLQPEHSESINLGLAYQTANMNVSVDYWNVEITEGLTIPTAQGLINLEYEGRALPSGAIIVRDATGAIRNCEPGQTSGCGITRPWLNLASQDYTGVDVRFDYRVPLSGSDLNFRVLHSHILEALEQTTPDPAEDVSGTQDSPEFRTVFVAEWSRGDHIVSWITHHVDSYMNSNDEKVSSWTTHDIQYVYDVTANGRVLVGVQNVTDEDPPLDPYNDTAQPFNSEIYSMDGRVPYVTYRQRF